MSSALCVLSHFLGMLTKQGGDYHPDLQTRKLTQDLDPGDFECKTHAFFPCAFCLLLLLSSRGIPAPEYCLLGVAGGHWEENRPRSRQEQGFLWGPGYFP